jgi:hypothetical protein
LASARKRVTGGSVDKFWIFNAALAHGTYSSGVHDVVGALAKVGKVDTIVVTVVHTFLFVVQGEQELYTMTVGVGDPCFSSFWIGRRLLIRTEIALLFGIGTTTVKGSTLNDRVRTTSSRKQWDITGHSIDVFGTSGIRSLPVANGYNVGSSKGTTIGAHITVLVGWGGAAAQLEGHELIVLAGGITLKVGTTIDGCYQVGTCHIRCILNPRHGILRVGCFIGIETDSAGRIRIGLLNGSFGLTLDVQGTKGKEKKSQVTHRVKVERQFVGEESVYC